jgi:UDP:flavonoid glycosyltransferase YjiC (YdhE family)
MKVFIYTLPASGHINPLLPIVEELILLNPDIEVYFYLTENFRKKIESTGARLRVLKNFDILAVSKLEPMNNERKQYLFEHLRLLIESFSINCEFMANEINDKKPDLILYDLLWPHTAWLKDYYTKWFNIAQNTSAENRKKLKFCPNWPFPKMMSFVTSFVIKESIYPNHFEESILLRFPLSVYWEIFKLFITYFKYGFKLGIGFRNPINDIKMRPLTSAENILVFVMSELQPRSHLFDNKFYKFIGSTIKLDDGSCNKSGAQFDTNNQLADILKLFESKETKAGNIENDKLFLIYISLGTINNNNYDIYKTLIEGFINFDDEPIESRNRNIKVSQLKIIVSTGEKVYKQFEIDISINKFKLPDNITLMKSVPQIEVLKRASLFVTHCGLNSVSEAIHFAVPMVCVPISSDQPLVAYRVADELGLGVRLDFVDMKSEQVRNAAHKILNDKSYFIRAERFSKLSKEYKGYLNGAQLIKSELRKLKKAIL